MRREKTRLEPAGISEAAGRTQRRGEERGSESREVAATREGGTREEPAGSKSHSQRSPAPTQSSPSHAAPGPFPTLVLTAVSFQNFQKWGFCLKKKKAGHEVIYKMFPLFQALPPTAGLTSGCLPAHAQKRLKPAPTSSAGSEQARLAVLSALLRCLSVSPSVPVVSLISLLLSLTHLIPSPSLALNTEWFIFETSSSLGRVSLPCLTPVLAKPSPG